MLAHEMAGETLAPAKSRNLPNQVLRAIDNAMHVAGLKRNVKATLAEICRFVSQKEPLATIFPTKACIAKRLGSSERTVYRHLQLLVEQSLIEIQEQERKSRSGRFAIARIKLTYKAAVLLGFIVDKNLFIHSEPSDNLTDRHTLTEPTITNNQPPQRFENGLPIDLSWMTGNGVSKGGIFRLMGMATKNKKRLSDVVMAVKHQIRELKGRHLVAYLAKLILGPTDFAVAAANERRRAAERIEADIKDRKVAIFRQRFSNTALTNKAQTKLYLIDQGARFVQIISKNFAGTQPLNDCSEIIAAIESGLLVLATMETERQLRLR